HCVVELANVELRSESTFRIGQLQSRRLIEFLQSANFLFEISQQWIVRSGVVEWHPTDDLMTGLEHQRKTKLGRDHTFAFARPQIHDHLIEQFRDRIQPCDVTSASFSLSTLCTLM